MSMQREGMSRRAHPNKRLALGALALSLMRSARKRCRWAKEEGDLWMLTVCLTSALSLVCHGRVSWPVGTPPCVRALCVAC